jgi:hypothetical protein
MATKRKGKADWPYEMYGTHVIMMEVTGTVTIKS